MSGGVSSTAANDGGAKPSTNLRPAPRMIGASASRAFRYVKPKLSARPSAASTSQITSQGVPLRVDATNAVAIAVSPASASPHPEIAVNALARSIVSRM
jgi:hypothetical protein